MSSSFRREKGPSDIGGQCSSRSDCASAQSNLRSSNTVRYSIWLGVIDLSADIVALLSDSADVLADLGLRCPHMSGNPSLYFGLNFLVEHNKTKTDKIMSQVLDSVSGRISTRKIVMFSKRFFPYCVKAKVNADVEQSMVPGIQGTLRANLAVSTGRCSCMLSWRSYSPSSKSAICFDHKAVKK